MPKFKEVKADKREWGQLKMMKGRWIKWLLRHLLSYCLVL